MAQQQQTQTKPEQQQPPRQEQAVATLPTPTSFLTGARWRSGLIWIEKPRSIFDFKSGQKVDTPGAYVEIKENRISLTAACDFQRWPILWGCTREEALARAAEFLMKHPDFGRADGRGIFHDSSSTLGEIRLRAMGQRKRCEFFQEIGEGQSVQCTEYTDDPTDQFCKIHADIVAAALVNAGAQ